MNSGTPESAPSLAEVSRASTESDSLSRVLFERVDKRSEGSSHEASLTDFRSTQTNDMNSTTASDVSTSRPTCFDVETSNIGGLPGRLGLSRSSKKGSESDLPDGNESALQSGCGGGVHVAPSRLTDVFSMFDRQYVPWPKSSVSVDSGDDTRTEKQGNLVDKRSPDPELESVGRECLVLRELVKADSTKILQLKSSINAFRKRETIHLMETENLKAEIEALKREKDSIKERESQHIETIKILKNEVDVLTKKKESSQPEDCAELEQLRVENELFATQIIENEIELREIRALLNAIEEENSSMRQDLAEVHGRLNGDDEDISPGLSEIDLKMQVMVLSKKVEQLEHDTGLLNESMTLNRLESQAEFDDIKHILQAMSSSTTTPDYRSMSVVPIGEEVEVTIDGLVASGMDTRNEGQMAEHNWNGFCNCLT